MARSAPGLMDPPGKEASPTREVALMREDWPNETPARRPRSLPSTLLSLAVLLATVAPVSAQSIRGRVLDAEQGSGIPAAEVIVSRPGGVLAARVQSDSTGAFVVRLREAAGFWIRAAALGYTPGDSSWVSLESAMEMVEVELRLAPGPLAVEGLTIVARGLDLRHRATFGGFLDRHTTALDVGSARVLSIDDPEMATAGNVGDVLKWLPTERAGCTVVWVDGVVQPFLDIERFVMQGVAGIEFYVSQMDAPLEFRDGGQPCLAALDWTVLVVWRPRL